ncbi:MAG: hypothetical protein FJ303_17990 [Planctomycetes bacterium]|nr:hypothetical protein [Planctomycetota bacterium]
MNAVGIDLGTSNSIVAIYRRGRAESFPIEGRNLVPSCVAVKSDGTLLVGTQAKTRSLIEPTQSVLAIKRHMGDRQYRVNLGGREYSPVDISSMILKKLIDGASEKLGEPVKEAVISVPAYFTNNQKEDTRAAGEKIGLKVLALVPEPTAAAIASTRAAIRRSWSTTSAAARSTSPSCRSRPTTSKSKRSAAITLSAARTSTADSSTSSCRGCARWANSQAT